MRTITLYLRDAILWRAFRMACLARGTSASKEIERFMRDQLDTWQREDTSAHERQSP